MLFITNMDTDSRKVSRGARQPTLRYRVGVDIGGTFTDTVVFDRDSGAVSLVKVPSVPASPATGFLNGLERAVAQFGIDLRQLEFIGHGTTVATNTIIEQKGAKVGLITSDGFSDVLEIAYQTRPDLFDLMYDKPKPLVSRRMAVGVPERIDADGGVLVPLDEQAVAARARELQEAGAEAIVIAFLHSYRFPENERRARKVIGDACPNVPVVLSSEICPEYREYPRTSTAVVNAVLLPRVGTYIRTLSTSLEERGANTGLHLMTSSGGIMAAPIAAERPVQLLESGPAATVIGATYVAELAEFHNIVVFDMGGTTAKVALVTNGVPRVSDQFEVGHMAVASDTAGRGRGYPVRTPTVEMVEVGAGGGSVAAIDPGGALGVGPESMGADPGPVCYGQGGDRPTITDANLVLGRLNPAYFLGGEKELSVELAARAIERNIACPLGLTLTQAAYAIVEIGNARMAAALKLVSIRRGIDPRPYILVACGGAGPLHAAAIARQAAMSRVLVPPAPGLTAALGLLTTDLKHDFVRNFMRETAAVDVSDIVSVLKQLCEEGRAVLVAENVSPKEMRFVAQADISYLGQAFHLRIPIPEELCNADQVREMIQRFHEAHKRAYGFASESEKTIIVSLRVTALGMVTRPELRRIEVGDENASRAVKGRRQIYFDGAADAVSCLIYQRDQLRAGNVIAGPAVVEQMDTTTLLPPGSRAEMDRSGNMIISV